ncbi:hypothetical protein NBRC10512_002064 [Rhodotorula toruloides]|uniref:Uncharacterized protein n=1 Tax=Rhodotorula toruloides (strain NP11) TaxID=1130832 RepID=M7WMR4_RHOT1|nr:uncharacterized protein RHTO_05303 [Rhodotorula toruloides NP11]EMS19140.1 hypothetical protein RHTO_05303 [Rhodotorula toruloides NP11]
MSLASLVPSIQADPALMAQLLPWGLRYNILLPYCEADPDDPAAPSPRTDCPPWTAELEAYHATVHPDVWAILRADDYLDTSAIRQIRLRIEALKQSPRRATEDGACLDDLEVALDLLETRRLLRLDSLYALDVVRDKYFFLKASPSLPDPDHVVAQLPRDPSFKPPTAGAGSLWPIYVAPPPYLIKSDLVCFWHHGVDWDQYKLPDCPSAKADEALARRSLVALVRDGAEKLLPQATFDGGLVGPSR